jgi:hypothetical protein
MTYVVENVVKCTENQKQWLDWPAWAPSLIRAFYPLAIERPEHELTAHLSVGPRVGIKCGCVFSAPHPRHLCPEI